VQTPLALHLSPFFHWMTFSMGVIRYSFILKIFNQTYESPRSLPLSLWPRRHSCTHSLFPLLEITYLGLPRFRTVALCPVFRRVFRPHHKPPPFISCHQPLTPTAILLKARPFHPERELYNVSPCYPYLRTLLYYHCP